MLFNSIEFLIFFPIVVLGFFLIPKKIKHIWLLISSYYFYMCWNAKYALLILLSTTITYLSGVVIDRINNRINEGKIKTNLKNMTVAFSIVSNLGILFFFKYASFFLYLIETFASLTGLRLHVPEFDILLPVGISFYTFQALGYTIDVYRNDIKAEKNFFKYALFVSFFPQLVAGPIERSKNLLFQLSEPKEFDYDEAKEGFLLMLWGFFLKIVLADRIALYVDAAYDNLEMYGGIFTVMATVLFAIQVYCDFAGYSTIAVGTAKILGIELMDNFDAPYLSTDVASFWRRWHISLTSWFKDYLYIPIGGSRKGFFRKQINKLIVFVLSGLWHGADLSFVLWGFLNGIYQVMGEILMPVRIKMASMLHINRDSNVFKIIQGVITFILVDFAWIFFRAKDIGMSIDIIKSIRKIDISCIKDKSLFLCGMDIGNFVLMIIGIALLCVSDICKRKNIVLRKSILRSNYIFRVLFISLSITAILLFGIWGLSYNESNFIYFQF